MNQRLGQIVLNLLGQGNERNGQVKSFQLWNELLRLVWSGCVVRPVSIVSDASGRLLSHFRFTSGGRCSTSVVIAASFNDSLRFEWAVFVAVAAAAVVVVVVS